MKIGKGKREKSEKIEKTEKIDTILGPNACFEGRLVSEEGLRIDGEVKGKVECAGSLVIGSGGKVEAEVVASSVLVAGELIGNVTAKKRLEITGQGKVYGDIVAAELVLEEGVAFEGKCRMLTEKDVPEVSKAADEEELDSPALTLSYSGASS